MKITSLLFGAVLSIGTLHATPVTVTSVAPPNVGQLGVAPVIFKVPASTTAFYKMTWRTAPGGANYLTMRTGFRYDTSGVTTPDNLYCATTYAEIAAQATSLGITNLPAQVSGQP